MPARTLIWRFLRPSEFTVARQAIHLALALVAMQTAACSGKDDLPPATTNDPPTTTTTGDSGMPPVGEDATSAGGASGTGTGGSGGAGGTGAGGLAGSGGIAGAAGNGLDGAADSKEGGATVAVCGNGIREEDENCDGTDFGDAGSSCVRVGFSAGVLRCTLSCTFDKSQCSGVEVCDDQRDNDGDGKSDCADSDCANVCTDACGKPSPLSDPAAVNGSTEGRAKTIDPSCKDPTGPSGPEMVYQFTAQNTGMLDVLLSSANQLTVSIRGTCGSATTESACAPAGRRIATPIVRDQTVFIVVDGYEASAAGKFDLLVKSRPIKCGDAVRDEPEECDDGDELSGDGCSSTCQVESSEVEPNATAAQATPRGTAPSFYGRVHPSGDVDVVKVDVPGPASRLTVNTFDFGDGACGGGLLDSTIEILAADGTTVLARDDDSGDGFCSRVVSPSLPLGAYFVRVAASPQGETPTFPYVLRITVD